MLARETSSCSASPDAIDAAAGATTAGTVAPGTGSIIMGRGGPIPGSRMPGDALCGAAADESTVLGVCAAIGAGLGRIPIIGILQMRQRRIKNKIPQLVALHSLG